MNLTFLGLFRKMLARLPPFCSHLAITCCYINLLGLLAMLLMIAVFANDQFF